MCWPCWPVIKEYQYSGNSLRSANWIWSGRWLVTSDSCLHAIAWHVFNCVWRGLPVGWNPIKILVVTVYWTLFELKGLWHTSLLSNAAWQVELWSCYCRAIIWGPRSGDLTVTAFWDVTPLSRVQTYQCSVGKRWLPLKGIEDKAQKECSMFL